MATNPLHPPEYAICIVEPGLLIQCTSYTSSTAVSQLVPGYTEVSEKFYHMMFNLSVFLTVSVRKLSLCSRVQPGFSIPRLERGRCSLLPIFLVDIHLLSQKVWCLIIHKVRHYYCFSFLQGCYPGDLVTPPGVMGLKIGHDVIQYCWCFPDYISEEMTLHVQIFWGWNNNTGGSDALSESTWHRTSYTTSFLILIGVALFQVGRHAPNPGPVLPCCT